MATRRSSRRRLSRTHARANLAKAMYAMNSRVEELETIARANKRELELQFKRMAQIQLEIEQLKNDSSRR